MSLSVALSQLAETEFQNDTTVESFEAMVSFLHTLFLRKRLALNHGFISHCTVNRFTLRRLFACLYGVRLVACLKPRWSARTDERQLLSVSQYPDQLNST